MKICKSAKVTVTLTPGEFVALARRAANAGSTPDRVARSLVIAALAERREHEGR
jgi:hypothetical protein